jgi:hypothetical protein
MLLLMMELKGRFNTKMIKKAKFGEMYFDEMGGFESVETDRVTGAVSQCDQALFVSADYFARMSSARFTSPNLAVISVRVSCHLHQSR